MRQTNFAVLLSALLLAGCGSSSEIFTSDVKILPQGMGFRSQDWSKPQQAAEISLTRPATAEDYVDANGACAAAAPSVEGTAAAGPASLSGGVGLGMTECQVVQRAGHPTTVDVGSENNERKVVMTYSGGTWPGIYTFVGGRLKVVDQVAVPEPAKPARRQAKPKTAAR